MAARGAVLASLASVVVNIVLAARVSGQHRLTLRLAGSLALVVILGLVATAALLLLPPLLPGTPQRLLGPALLPLMLNRA